MVQITIIKSNIKSMQSTQGEVSLMKNWWDAEMYAWTWVNLNASAQ